MAEKDELVKSIQEMLKEETWTRAAISNYSKEKFVELAGFVEKAKSADALEEVLRVCDEQLSHSKNSIIALYLTSMISFQKGALDNSAFISLVDIFKKNQKDNVVEYLCESVLEDYPNNLFALRTLAEIYKNANDKRVWELYENIVRLDFNEADLVKNLAEHFEAEGDAEKATEYYKKAILRFINLKNVNLTNELWKKLVQTIPEEIDFFQLLKRKISKTIGSDKAALLLHDLYNYYKDNKKWDVAISLLKEILEADSKDSWARKEIIDCYKGKYASHSHLDDYIRSSDLAQSYRNVFEAINDFEKHIAFDAKNYVFHRTWGVGVIRKVDGDNLIINFGSKAGIHTISLKMAVSALTPLSKEHIWVLKATMPKEKLAEKVKKERIWALQTIIKSFDNNCDIKRIKAELVPAVLSTSEWTSWSSNAKKDLENEDCFGINLNDINMFTVRDNTITKDEKLANEFKAQKQFFSRIDILMKFINSEETDKSSEMFAEMFNYFVGYVKTIDTMDSFSKITEQILASYLVVQNIVAIFPQLAIPMKSTFQQIYEKIPDVRAMYELLKDTKNTSLRHDFLNDIKQLPDYADEYVRLFPTVLQGKMLKYLIEKGYTEKVQALAKNCFDNYKDFRDAVLYFFKECQNEEWFKNAGVSYERQLITLVQLIELCFREINSHVNTTDNKKIIKNALSLLEKDDALLNYMFENGEDSAKKMYTLINDVKDIDPSFKAKLRNKIIEKYPDIKFNVTEERVAAQKGMLVTAKKLDEKKALLEKLNTVDIPANAKEIEEARARGDLKENAEYKAAKEHQHKLQQDVKSLNEAMTRAVVFDPTTVTTAVVSFATTVTVHDNIKNTDETFTILGPWESDPENAIISYMAPLGNALLDAKVGENLKFTINEYKYDYTIKEIKAAKV